MARPDFPFGPTIAWRMGWFPGRGTQIPLSLRSFGMTIFKQILSLQTTCQKSALALRFAAQNIGGCSMRVSRELVVGLVFLFSLPVFAQMDKIVIPAGTPEDQALSAITAESDEAKKLPMYEDFIQKFASNPAA